MIAAFVAGALPWIWANTNSGFASLRVSSFPNSAITTLNTGYRGRLGIFAHLSLPIALDLRRFPSGGFLFGGAGSGLRHIVGVAATGAAIALVVLAVVLCALRGGRWLAIGVSVFAFPFLFAAQPGTWFWADGRYIVFLGPLLALAVVPGLEEACRRLPARARPHEATMAVGALTVVLLAGAVVAPFALAGDNQVSMRALATGWGDPNAPVVRAIATLQRGGVRDGFADYWVAYKLDFLSNQTMTITPAAGDVDRQKAFDRTVDRAPHQAWLFVEPSRTEQGFTQFAPTPMIAGPDGITEARFLAALDALHVPYRQIDAGALSAVVPDRRVTVAEVDGAGG